MKPGDRVIRLRSRGDSPRLPAPVANPPQPTVQEKIVSVDPENALTHAEAAAQGFRQWLDDYRR